MLILCSAQVDPVEIGTLPGIISESSGLQLDPSGIVWTFNDDDNVRIHAVQQSGAYAGQLILDGAEQVDYEDIAMDPAGTLYIGDFGNNDNDRTDLRIYILEDPTSSINGAIIPQQIDFTLSDQSEFPPGDEDLNFDIEAMIHFNQQIHLFSRNRTDPYDGMTKWYTLDDTPGTQIAQYQSSFQGNLSPDFSSITGADISPSGNRLALLSRGAIYLFTSPQSGDMFAGEMSYNFFTFTESLEGITFLDDCHLLISEESNGGDPARLFQMNSCEIISSSAELTKFELLVITENDRIRLVSPTFTQQALLTIHDTSGHLIHRQKDLSSIEFLNWPNGTYIITLYTDGQLYTSHFIK